MDIKKDAIKVLPEFFKMRENRPGRISEIKEYVESKCGREINSNTFYGIIYTAKQQGIITQGVRGEYTLSRYEPQATEQTESEQAAPQEPQECPVSDSTDESFAKEDEAVSEVPVSNEPVPMKSWAQLKEEILEGLQIRKEFSRILKTPVPLSYEDRNRAVAMEVWEDLAQIEKAMEKLELKLRGKF